MATINEMKKIFFPSKNVSLRHKHNHVVTSTPIKKHTSPLLKIDRWASPVEKILIPNQALIISQSLTEGTEGKNPCQVDNEEEKQSHVSVKSIDKICRVNNLPKANNPGENLASDDKAGSAKNIKKERWIIVDSEEEDILQSKTKALKRKKKTTSLVGKENLARKKKSRKLTEAKSASATVEEMESKKSDNKVSGIKPKVTRVTREDIPHSKSVTGIFKLGERDESSDNSDLSLIDRLPKKRNKTISQVDENLGVRKSSRKRCKPLEFWNGERMENVQDVIPDFGENGTKKNGKRTKARKVKDAKSELEEVEKVQKVSKSVPNIEKSRKSEGKTLSKSAKSKNSQTKVGLSDIESTSKINENLNLGEQVNSVQLQTLAEQRLLKYKNFHTIPHLKNVMGIISSSVIVMKSETLHESKASEQHHLIFCVMAGTVKAVIAAESESSARIKPCGHFVVPCGASYCIDNFNKKIAILSRFEITCGTGR